LPTATVLLCVRNGAATLERQLDALSRQEFDGDWELVVVDNASDDGTRAIVSGWMDRFPQLRVVDESLVGTNWARNRGVRESCSDIIVLCDADDEVSRTWLRSMVAGLARFDLVGGRLDPDHINEPTAPRAACIQRHGLPSVFRWEYAVGASLGFRRDVYDAIDGFDTAFAFGSDDADFCIRAQIAGYSIGFVPSAVVDYRVRHTARGVMRQRFSYGRGHQRLVDKHTRLGNIHSRSLQRWKVVVVSGVRLVALLPQLFSRSTRLQYLAAVAYLGGRITELVSELSWRASPLAPARGSPR
jgi:glycosyltransferase involved in cell wall biosynthesis